MISILLNRQTPARLAEPGPRPDQLQQALQAAQQAPDHGRLQPWRFVIIEGGARAKFGAALAEALAERQPASTPEELARESQKPLRAPLLVVVAASITPSPKAPEIEQVAAAAAAAENLALAFHAQGFGCQWKTGAAAYDPQIKAVLGLHPSDHIIGLMYVGSIAEPGKPKPAPREGIVRYWS